MPKPRSPEQLKTKRLPKEVREPKEPREPREPKASKEPKPREPKLPKEAKPVKNNKESRLPKENKEARSLKDFDVESEYSSDDENNEIFVKPKHEIPNQYPVAIAKLLEMSLLEADEVREAFKGRNRQNYVKIFQAYKDKLSDRDYSIIRGATGYLYDHSRIKSIDKDTALWMLGIHEIPASQILSYTSKTILESIAKDHGLSYAGKKSETLINNIRSVLDYSK